jgi:alpha-ketoglutaric semialdehyde dehydrogenase
VAEEIMALGQPLLERCAEETALPGPRLVSERGRTVNQLRMFAELVREGSWVDARLDTPIPDREPIPKPDLRRMLIPLGPVAVFGASNFPLAFSVAGGDTASALAAGNPVIAKAHPSHPGTSELVAKALARAIEHTDLHPGVFSLLFDAGTAVGLSLVREPRVKAVGFTGSRQGGLALLAAAQGRPEPIPVYAEMGSVNPVVLLPSALGTRGGEIAAGLAHSMTLGVGQFCTKPGLILGLKSPELDELVESLAGQLRRQPPGTMLSPGICRAYEAGATSLGETTGVELVARGEAASAAGNEASAALYKTDAETLGRNPGLIQEVFGPAALIVQCGTRRELEDVVASLDGHLTATLHAEAEDLAELPDLVACLEQRVGRVVFNGFPTGVEVCPSMHHGGPFPATTDPRSTSVGTAAIQRFARPICYQNVPDEVLPPELQAANPLRIWRTVDGTLTKTAVGSPA